MRFASFCIALLVGLTLRGDELPLERIAFGSCSKPWRAEPLWPSILSHRPGLWIWLGDIVYGDEDMAKLAGLYASQKGMPDYQRLLAGSKVIGVWDDNDYGKDDGGIEFAKKAESQKLLLDFLDEPPESARRKQQGVHASYTFGPPGRQVKVMLLDGRYFRQKPGAHADLLGEEQWAWLERELTGSTAQIHFIGSDIQVVAEEHLFEKWANFPQSRRRLFDLLARTKPRCPIILSGDRHLGEISRIDLPQLGPLYDITSSGMTHFAFPSLGNFFYDFRKEPNRYRVGQNYCGLNFGLVEIDWQKQPPAVELQVRDAQDAVRCAVKIQQP